MVSKTPGQIIAGFVIDSLGEGAKVAMRNFLNRRIESSPMSPRMAVEETPPGASGCPFCFIAARLGVAYRYMRRAKSSRQFIEIYRELAVDEVSEASYLATAIMQPDHRDYNLALSVNRIEVALSSPLGTGNLEAVLSELWSASEVALMIAERNQFGMPQDNVVEGEAREVS